MIKFYNTLTKKKEEFKPLKDIVGIYTCGPTVYEYAHIGNMRAYLFVDVLKRVLLYNNYKIKHVTNVTDVGHLTSDADTGDDKMEKSAREKKMNAYDVAKYYTQAYLDDTKKLNMLDPDVLVKATETVKEQIDLIKIMEERGFIYTTTDGVYFDTSLLENYGEMANLNNVCLKPGARVDMGEKKNETDFALWKFSEEGEKRDMEWDSPWGVGFPGWHTECVAMAQMHLDIPFDIHCGGADHICVHHTNEIAQSYAVFNENFAKIWMHNDFVIKKDGKMSKSKGEITTISLLSEKGFHPLAFRYLVLNAHYRSKIEFSYEALEGAQNAYNKIKERVRELKSEIVSPSLDYKKEFESAINDDLNTPLALSVFWKALQDNNLSKEERYSTIIDFDSVLGLNLKECEEEDVPEEIALLAKERENARIEKDFKKADVFRQRIEEKGYCVEDCKDGYKLKKK